MLYYSKNFNQMCAMISEHHRSPISKMEFRKKAFKVLHVLLVPDPKASTLQPILQGKHSFSIFYTLNNDFKVIKRTLRQKKNEILKILYWPNSLKCYQQLFYKSRLL